MEHKPYQQILDNQSRQPSQQPIPVANSQGLATMPGVLSQTNNLLRPVNIEELNRGRDK